LDNALALLVHRRVGEISRRLERMLVRFAAGLPMVRKARGAADGVREVVPGAVVRAKPVRVWPLGFGWILASGAHVAAGHGGHLRVVLEHPEMVALLRASPSARRLLSPVCRMLGVEASVLSPRLPGEVVVEVVKPVRVRRKKASVEKLPPLVWPRGVLAMVRKYKKLGKW
jgi:hypothetical protein